MGEREEAERFLDPALDHLHDPFLLFGMEEAVCRLEEARRRGEKVAIVGDYDVDGVTATALLLAVFRALGLEASPILPHRLREGYGFQPLHVQRAQQLGCDLMVTVDCGSCSHAAAHQALAAKLDVIVTDHHRPGQGLPGNVLHINPHQPGCPYPFPDLAGVGLALKLALALAHRCQRRLDMGALLRIACLGTIADMVPLRGENRVIAALGLRSLARTRSAGLRALFQEAGIRPPFTAVDVGYRIGPRLNAAGRLASAEGALELLLTRDPGRARELARDLERQNQDRRAEEARVVEEARQRLAERQPPPPLLVAWKEGWHQGVLGIAASRLAREFHRPVILLAVKREVATGSGRSIEGIDLHGFLSPWARDLERFGGHAQALGLTASLDKLPRLVRAWEEAAAGWPAEVLVPRLEYELHLEPGELSAAFLEAYRRLEPFGAGNPEPLLRVGPLSLAGRPRTFGKGHLGARAQSPDGTQVEIVGWGWEGREGLLQGRFEILAYLEPQTFRRLPVLRIQDARPL